VTSAKKKIIPRPSTRLHCCIANGIPTIPAPTIALIKLNAAPETDDFGASSTSLTFDIRVPPGEVNMWDLGGAGAKKGDFCTGLRVSWMDFRDIFFFFFYSK
jgi:hypothetical protein